MHLCQALLVNELAHNVSVFRYELLICHNLEQYAHKLALGCCILVNYCSPIFVVDLHRLGSEMARLINRAIFFIHWLNGSQIDTIEPWPIKVSNFNIDCLSIVIKCMLLHIFPRVNKRLSLDRSTVFQDSLLVNSGVHEEFGEVSGLLSWSTAILRSKRVVWSDHQAWDSIQSCLWLRLFYILCVTLPSFADPQGHFSKVESFEWLICRLL